MTSAMIPVTVTYQKPGTEPPLFIAGTFSDPPWQPLEMECTTSEDGAHIFKKEILAEQGSKLQYKFRVGTGDWWVLDEEAPIVPDGMGNQNNLVEVTRGEAGLNGSVKAVREESKPEAAAQDAEADSKNGQVGSNKSQSKEAEPPEPKVEAKPGPKIEHGGPEPDTAASMSELGAEPKKADPVLDVKKSEPEAGPVGEETEAEEGKSAAEIASLKSGSKAADMSLEPDIEHPKQESVGKEPEAEDGIEKNAPSSITAPDTRSGPETDKDEQGPKPDSSPESKELEEGAAIGHAQPDSTAEGTSSEPAPSVETVAADPAGSFASEEPTVGEPVVEEASTPPLDNELGARADPIGTGPNGHETESSQPTQDESVVEVQEIGSKDVTETTALEPKPEVEEAQTESEVAPAQANDQVGESNPKSEVEVKELPLETERSDADLEVGHASGDPTFNHDDSLPANDAGPQKDDGGDVPRLLPKGPIEALKQEFAISDSGRNTPAYVRTAAEVADSAALLDEEEPEPDIPDDEAGRLGVRRLSSTPIPEVAQTAAEVADSAMFLDHENDEDDAIRDEPPPLFAHEVLGSSEDSILGENQFGAPLFAYECAGTLEGNKAPSDEGRHSLDFHRPTRDYDPDDLDLNDPTLERFPSNREEIFDTVRRIETGLNEDRASFEGLPPSPIFGPGRRSSEGSGDRVSLSPSASPTVPRPGGRLDIPRGSQGYETPERSASMVSLQSIVEETAVDDEEDGAPLILRPSPLAKPKLKLEPPASDDDEGVEFGEAKKSPKSGDASPSGYLTPDRAASPAPPDSPTEPAPNTALPIPVTESGDEDTAKSLGENDSTEVLKENIKAESPSIVVHRAESPETKKSDVPSPSQSPRETTSTADHDDRAAPTSKADQEPYATEGSHDDGQEAEGKQTGARSVGDGHGGGTTSGADAAQTSGRDMAVTGTLTKRQASGSAERATTPTSVHSTGMDAAKQGTWFQAFFRLVFVEWIGGLISRLWGGQRKA